MAKRHLLRDLAGRASDDLVDLLARQIDTAIDGARLARRAASGELDTATARSDIATIETDGDEARGALVVTLASSLVTPLDREDLVRLSRSIDDVLDNLQDFVTELDLFQTPNPGFDAVLAAVIDALEALARAVSSVKDGGEDVAQRALVANKACTDIRRSYQLGMRDVLTGQVTDTMLRTRELLRRLDVVGLRVGEAVAALADAAVKRSL